MLSAIIVAAGSSERMGFDKLFALVSGKPVIAHTIAAFERTDCVDEIILVGRADSLGELRKIIGQPTKVKQIVDGVEKEVDQTTEEKIPGYLEAVYHLYSIAHKHGPLIIRMRTANRTDGARLPSLTPVWRSAELQEREIFDLYGVHFEGHPDLRRILMWDEFVDHPMRKDYVQPDDFEWEPTPHDEVLERAKQHYTPRPQLDGAEQITSQSDVATPNK